jgi:hypothetical protein
MEYGSRLGKCVEYVDMWCSTFTYWVAWEMEVMWISTNCWVQGSLTI